MPPSVVCSCGKEVRRRRHAPCKSKVGGAERAHSLAFSSRLATWIVLGAFLVAEQPQVRGASCATRSSYEYTFQLYCLMPAVSQCILPHARQANVVAWALAFW
mmetsp:Transcript_32515/g.81899  ORF Transcript_32515/g.81899 Transcript_32515/m.81899 type:complete len:103 (+) Transcript_32515:633-941(+)